MTDLLACKYVIKKIAGMTRIDSKDKELFVSQYRTLLEQTKGTFCITYVFRTRDAIPRLNGTSDILYIGETKHDVWSRYHVSKDTNEYWHIYSVVIEKYGPITIDVYETTDHKITERTFLNQYFQDHKELPPLNRKG